MIMSMWNWLTPANLIDLQRQAMFRYMGDQARALLEEGYPVEADQMLDDMMEACKRWEIEKNKATF